MQIEAIRPPVVPQASLVSLMPSATTAEAGARLWQTPPFRLHLCQPIDTVEYERLLKIIADFDPKMRERVQAVIRQHTALVKSDAALVLHDPSSDGLLHLEEALARAEALAEHG